jgi:ribonuclease P protein component
LTLRETDAPAGRNKKPAVNIGISKRVAPKAVVRNRMKRLIREALRKRIRTEPARIYWIRVDKIPADPSYALVESALVELFHK